MTEEQRIAYAKLDSIRNSMNILHEYAGTLRTRTDMNMITPVPPGQLSKLEKTLADAVEDLGEFASR